jgi:hypothetical protein
MTDPDLIRFLDAQDQIYAQVPMAKTLNLDSLKAAISELDPEAPKLRKPLEFWDRMLSLLKRAKTERKGLEIGPLQMLLEKVAVIKGPDSLA